MESLGALVFHVARHFGWRGEVLLNYGSIEFLGPYVDQVSTAALALTGAAFGWLLLWRLRAAHFAPHTLADAALTAVLLFTVTSRVISPQYLVWLVGLAAVCLTHRASRMGAPALLVVLASFVTVLEFPLGFSHVVLSDWYGVTLLVVRNGLLVAATVTAARRLWRATVPPAAASPSRPSPPARRRPRSPPDARATGEAERAWPREASGCSAELSGEVGAPAGGEVPRCRPEHRPQRLLDRARPLPVGTDGPVEGAEPGRAPPVGDHPAGQPAAPRRPAPAARARG